MVNEQQNYVSILYSVFVISWNWLNSLFDHNIKYGKENACFKSSLFCCKTDVTQGGQSRQMHVSAGSATEFIRSSFPMTWYLAALGQT